MSRKNDPAPILAASIVVNDGCDWLAEVLKGGLDQDAVEIALDLAQECFAQAIQILVQAAYTTEATAFKIVDGQEFVEYREVVANRLALKALDLFTEQTNALMQALETQCPLLGVVDKKWIVGMRKLLPEFCNHGFAAPLQKSELPRTPRVAETGLAGLLRWIFARMNVTSGHA